MTITKDIVISSLVVQDRVDVDLAGRAGTQRTWTEESMFRRTFTWAGLLTLLVTAVGVASLAAPAQALPPPQDLFFYSGHVYNGATGNTKCLDSGISTNAQMRNCTTIIYQQWTYTTAGGYNQINGNSPPGCLDDGAGLNGSGAFLNTCNGSPHQRWQYNINGQLVNLASGRCLDRDLATIKVQVWDCNAGSNQVWWFEFVTQL